MNLIDTNGIQYVVSRNLHLKFDYFMVPDVVDEVEVRHVIYGSAFPKRVFKILDSDYFDEAIYLKHYFNILNKYGKRSFFNMTGFGDVSILAALHMLAELFNKRNQTEMFQSNLLIKTYTNDDGLTKKIAKELSEKNFIVLPVTEIV
jgi:hypothetical protein